MPTVTLFTIFFAFLPSIILTFLYLLFFRAKRNHFVEAFIVLMYVQVVSFFLMTIQSWEFVGGQSYDPPLFDPYIGDNTFIWVFFNEFLFQFANTFQTFFIWIMVSFVGVLFGMLVLALKLALQDPLKMRFSNVIRSITKKEPVSDGYSGFKERVQNITFQGVERQPMDPEVISKAWRESWKDYLIIGLATLLPSISIYATSPSEPAALYGYNIIIFLTWIYRFGYPASNRIAKGAGLTLGNRDIGSEMMRGVLGWFFRFNLILSVISIITSVNRFLAADNLFGLIAYYGTGIIYATPPIILAIILLPMSEDFSIVLYKRTFDRLRGIKSMIAETGKSLRGIVGSITAGGLVTGAYIGAVVAITMVYSFFTGTFTPQGRLVLFPGGIVDADVFSKMAGGANNDVFSMPMLWITLLLMIPFVSMLLLGIFGHLFGRMKEGGEERYAIISGFIVATTTWVLLPGLDYIVAVSPTSAIWSGELFFRLRPNIIIGGEGNLLLRLAYQFIFNLPVFIAATLFIVYYFQFRRRWREHTGEESAPLLSITQRDVKDVVVMFFGGILVSALGVLLLSYVIPEADVINLIYALIGEIGDPDGLEGVLRPMAHPWDMFAAGNWFLVYAEHNIIRTFLMLFVGPVFWSAVLWLVAAKYKTEDDKAIATGSTIGLVILIALTVWVTFRDNLAGYLYFDAILMPYWTFAAYMGLRAFLFIGLALAVFLIIIIVRWLMGREIGGWWYPVVILMLALEYFIYDDQFIFIALIILPLIIALFYKAFSRDPRAKEEDILLSYIRFSMMSLAISEVLSTALLLGGITIINYFYGIQDLVFFLATILPHAVIEVPTFLFAAAASLRIARDLGSTVSNEEWDEVPRKTRKLVADERTWRAFLLIIFLLAIASLIEAFVTPLVIRLVLGFI
jgi:hypothetical protein